MKRLVLIPLFGLVVTSQALAQQEHRAPTPKTKLEAFEAQSGAVVIRGFSKIGELRGIFGGAVTVESKEFMNATTAKREFGVTLEVKETSRLERNNTSYVDYDEIPSLLRGIDYIAKVDKSITKLDNFQADYRTKDDLRVSTFSMGSGEVMAAVTSGTIGATSVRLKIADLGKLRELIASALARLDAIKGGDGS